MRQINKNAANTGVDALAKLKIEESVAAKLEKQKQQIRNRFSNVPQKEANKSTKPKIVNLPSIKIIGQIGAEEHITTTDKENKVNDCYNDNLEESNLFDTKMDIIKSYLADNDNKSAAIRDIYMNANNETSDKDLFIKQHEKFNSVESFAILEQKLNEDAKLTIDAQNNVYELNKSIDDENDYVMQDKIDKYSSNKKNADQVNAQIYSNQNGSFIEGKEDNSNHYMNNDVDVPLKNFLYDDMLGCYYDPVTKEYYAES